MSEVTANRKTGKEIGGEQKSINTRKSLGSNLNISRWKGSSGVGEVTVNRGTWREREERDEDQRGRISRIREI